MSGGTTFSSLINGQNNPGALNIEFDLPISAQNAPQGNVGITVWGVGLGMIGQAANLNGANFTLTAGMKPGLPLATAAAPQAGIVCAGTVFSSYGNWQGTDQSLTIIGQAGAQGLDQNVSFNWIAGQTLASAIAATLSQAFPGYKQVINIAPLFLPSTEPGLYGTIWQWAGYLNDITKRYGTPIYGPNYPGVMISVTGSTIYAYDFTVAQTPKQIAFQDLIGQPTWIKPLTVTFKTVMRSDIGMTDTIQFPQGVQAPYALTTPASVLGPNSPASSKSIFQGKFFISGIHHYANFRQADGDSWCSVFEASPVTLVNT